MTAAPIKSTTATSTPGTFGIQCCSTRMTMSPETARWRRPLSPSPQLGFHFSKPSRVSDQGVGVHRETEQLRKLAHQDRECEAGHVANLGGLGEQVGHKSPASPRPPESWWRPPVWQAFDARATAREGDFRWHPREEGSWLQSSDRARNPAPAPGSTRSHDGVSGETEHRRVEARNGRKARDSA